MAVLPIQLELLKHIRTLLPNPIAMLSLGYPDILATPEIIAGLFGEDIANGLKYRDDSAGIVAWHGLEGELSRIPETEHLLSALGISFSCIDIAASRGVERIIDLNFPLPDDLHGSFHVVMDPGTIEHCANIGQALMNLAKCVQVGGFVIHCNPMSMYNHGFYNLNPTLYADFYEHNGFSLEMMTGMAGHGLQRQFFSVPPFQRFANAPANASLVVVARRQQDKPLSWPVQRKYQMNSALKA